MCGKFRSAPVLPYEDVIEKVQGHCVAGKWTETSILIRRFGRCTGTSMTLSASV